MRRQLRMLWRPAFVGKSDSSLEDPNLYSPIVYQVNSCLPKSCRATLPEREDNSKPELVGTAGLSLLSTEWFIAALLCGTHWYLAISGPGVEAVSAMGVANNESHQRRRCLRILCQLRLRRCGSLSTKLSSLRETSIFSQSILFTPHS